MEVQTRYKPNLEQFGPQGVRARDVVHAAVMKSHDLTRIITTDQHFELLPDVRRLDPQDLFVGGLAVAES
ncbi:MAG: hypothetical protein R3293_23820 [Candidatus Promineifilaceae bacterium]|nr:hypothetical protein [Candidatus Promineifilaceae bacterium]